MKTTHSALTLLILELNHLVDTGRYDGITLAEVKSHIRAGDVLQFLRDRTGDDSDFSMFLDAGGYQGFDRFYSTYLQSILDAYGGKERRKWRVENRGLCLLIAWTNEIIQQGHGWRPDNNIAGVEYP